MGKPVSNLPPAEADTEIRDVEISPMQLLFAVLPFLLVLSLIASLS